MNRTQLLCEIEHALNYVQRRSEEIKKIKEEFKKLQQDLDKLEQIEKENKELKEINEQLEGCNKEVSEFAYQIEMEREVLKEKVDELEQVISFLKDKFKFELGVSVVKEKYCYSLEFLFNNQYFSITKEQYNLLKEVFESVGEE